MHNAVGNKCDAVKNVKAMQKIAVHMYIFVRARKEPGSGFYGARLESSVKEKVNIASVVHEERHGT